MGISAVPVSESCPLFVLLVLSVLLVFPSWSPTDVDHCGHCSANKRAQLMSEIKTCGPFAANTHIAHTHSTHTPIRTHLRTWLFSAVRNELTWRIINIKCYTYKLNKMAQLKLPARLLLLSTTRLMTWPSSSQSKYIPHIYMLHIYVCVCVCMLWGYTYVLGDFCVCGSHYYILAL